MISEFAGSPCGNRCKNSDGGVDGSAFRGRDATFDWTQQRQDNNAAPVGGCTSGECGTPATAVEVRPQRADHYAQDAPPNIAYAQPVFTAVEFPIDITTSLGSSPVFIQGEKYDISLILIDSATGKPWTSTNVPYTYEVIESPASPFIFANDAATSPSGEQNVTSLGESKIGSIIIDFDEVIAPDGIKTAYVPRTDIEPSSHEFKITIRSGGYETEVSTTITVGRENSKNWIGRSDPQIKVTGVPALRPHIGSMKGARGMEKSR